MSQLQDMADIAQNQLRTMQSQQQGREREMKSLRQQVREFQVQSDDKSLIGNIGMCSIFSKFSLRLVLCCC